MEDPYTLPRKQGPEMSAYDAVEYIKSRSDEVSRQWLLKKARVGPEAYDGILGWVKIPFNAESGDEGGWIPRHMMDSTKVEPDTRLALWFDRIELDRWIAARAQALAEHTANLQGLVEEIEIPKGLREHILKHAPEATDESGGIIRTRLRDILMETYGYSERAVYKPIQKIAEELGWPYPAAMPRRPRFKHRRYKEQEATAAQIKTETEIEQFAQGETETIVVDIIDGYRKLEVPYILRIVAVEGPASVEIYLQEQLIDVAKNVKAARQKVARHIGPMILPEGYTIDIQNDDEGNTIYTPMFKGIALLNTRGKIAQFSTKTNNSCKACCQELITRDYKERTK